MQNSLYVQLLRSPILAALFRGTAAAGVSQTLRRGTIYIYKEWNYGTFAQGANCIFGWAAITLVIGSHSTLIYFYITFVAFLQEFLHTKIQISFVSVSKCAIHSLFKIYAYIVFMVFKYTTLTVTK